MSHARNYLVMAAIVIAFLMLISPVSASFGQSAVHSYVNAGGHSSASIKQTPASPSSKTSSVTVMQSQTALSQISAFPGFPGISSIGKQIYNASPESPYLQSTHTYKVSINLTNNAGNTPWTAEIFTSPSVNNPVIRDIFHLQEGFEYANSTTGSSMVAFLANGTYELYAGPGSSFISNTSLYVAGSSVSVNIHFPVFYKFTVSVTSLPATGEWNMYAFVANSSGFFSFNKTSNLSMTAYLPNGTYAMDIGPLGTLMPAFTKGYKIAGSASDVSYTFPALYSFTVKAQNVPAGHQWAVEILSNYSGSLTQTIYANSSKGDSMTGYLPLASYLYAGLFSLLFTSSIPVTGVFNVTGSGKVLNIVFPILQRVTFNANNFTPGYDWSVQIFENGSSYSTYSNSSTTDTMIAFLANGSYNYIISYSGYSNSAAFTVSGPETINVTLPDFYRVTFVASNLPAGMSWSLSLFNSNSIYVYFNLSAGTSMEAMLPNGTFTYTASISGIVVSSGTFTVSGATTTINIKLNSIYAVTFLETGIPLGFSWIFYLYNASSGMLVFDHTLNQNTLTANMTNGTYFADVGIDSGSYGPIEYFNVSYFTVNGAPLNEAVKVPRLYNVTFLTNLQPTITWTLSIYSTTYFYNYFNNTNIPKVTLLASNGSYHYSATVSGLSTFGNFTVNGSPLTIKLTFPRLYFVTFIAKNITSTETWSVGITNLSSFSGSYFSVTGSTIQTYEPNGSYEYYVSAGVTSLGPFFFTVAGSNVTVNVPLPGLYNITFKETGLPYAPVWTVSIGTTNTYITMISFGTTLTVQATNGTYVYTVASDLKRPYLATPSSGTVTLKGSSATVSIKFAEQFYVTFNETALPGTSDWSTSQTFVSSHMAGFDPYSSTFITANTAFNTNGMVMSGVNSSNEVTGIGTTGSYSAGFTVNVTAAVLSGTGSPVSILLENAQKTEYLAVRTDACLTDSFGYGIYYSVTGYASGPYNESSFYTSPSYGTAYTYSLSVSSTGVGSIRVLDGSTTVASVTGLNVGTGQFYLFLGQSTVFPSYPSQLGVSLWKSVTITSSTGSMLFSYNFENGPLWSVNLGSNTINSVTGTIAFVEVNGSYSYTVSTSSSRYMASPSKGTVAVSGSNVSKTVAFSRKYTAVFTETGLPAGTSWGVTLSGTTEMSTGTTDTFSVTNGSYSYAISNTSAYYAVHYSGTVAVSGSNTTVDVIFEHYAYIVGNVKPVNATVTVNGRDVSVNSTGGFNVSVTAGSYNVTASENGYFSHSFNFNLSSGGVEHIILTLAKKNPGSSTSGINISGMEELEIIGGIVAVVAIAGGASYLLKKRK